MALNDKGKGKGFGFNIEEKFKDVNTKTASGAEGAANIELEDAEDIREPQQRERKTRNVTMLTYDSLIKRMDAYAKKRGVSRAVVFETAMTAYLDQVDPKK